MRDALGHRGPDGHGEIVRDNLILGHVRLAIIDVGGGAQPMTSPDGAVSLSYNGECYNFLELMTALEQRGWSFATRCDSEVLLASYVLDGSEFDETLNGMYAYIILDERVGRSTLSMSVDPIGIKPLFVFQDEELFLVASEIRAIAAALRSLGKPVAIARDAVADYLEFGWVPAPATLLENVRRLQPGERLCAHLADGSLHSRPTRSLPSPDTEAIGRDDLDDRVLQALRRVVSRQTISDVPLGFFLSGGVDSSLLLAIASELGLQTRNFTIEFAGSGHGVAQSNEAEVAREVARHFDSPIDVVRVDEDTLRSSVDRCFAAMDQPLADPACLPLMLLSEFAGQHVKVCLSGDGGDELFQGYLRHQLLPWKRRWASMPRWGRRLAAMGASAFPEKPSSGASEVLRKIRVAHNLLDSPGYVSGPFEGETSLTHRTIPWWNLLPDNSASPIIAADLGGQLAGQMLPKTDNMTMAASLECRVPLLDLELVSLAQAVPPELSRQGRAGKLPLRRLLGRYLPPEIANRPKHGFRVPLTTWFRGAMAERIRDSLGADLGEAHEFIPQAQIGDIVESHLSGAKEHSIRLWSLLALQSWRQSVTG